MPAGGRSLRHARRRPGPVPHRRGRYRRRPASSARRAAAGSISCATARSCSPSTTVRCAPIRAPSSRRSTSTAPRRRSSWSAAWRSPTRPWCARWPATATRSARIPGRTPSCRCSTPTRPRTRSSWASAPCRAGAAGPDRAVLPLPLSAAQHGRGGLPQDAQHRELHHRRRLRAISAPSDGDEVKGTVLAQLAEARARASCCSTTSSRRPRTASRTSSTS